MNFQFPLVDSHLFQFILRFRRENGLIQFAAYSDKEYVEFSTREMNKWNTEDVFHITIYELNPLFLMAVPKKRTSRSKKKIRKNVRKGKAYRAAIKAFSLAKSISTGHSKSFYCIVNDDSSGSSESKLTAIDLDDP